MASTCPVCGQPVSKLDEDDLRKRIEELASPLVKEQKQKLQHDFAQQLDAERKRAERGVESRLRVEYESRIEKECKAAAKDAERLYKKQIAAAEKKAAESGTKFEAVRSEMERRFEKQSTAAVRQAVRESERRIDKEKSEREKERLRHETERQRLQLQLEGVTRRLESQSAEELGEDGERDLAVILRQEFQEIVLSAFRVVTEALMSFTT